MLAEEEGGDVVARIRFVHPSNSNLLALTLILVHLSVSYFSDRLKYESSTDSNYVLAARAVGLYNDIKEFKLSLEQAVKLRATTSLLRYFFSRVSLSIRRRCRDAGQEVRVRTGFIYTCRWKQ